MHRTPPSDNPNRRIEIVPLGDPAETTPTSSIVAAAVTRSEPAEGSPSADLAFDSTSGERSYPRLVLHPVPAWTAPSVRTTRHPAVSTIARPVSVVIDLTDAEPSATESLDLERDAIALPTGSIAAAFAPRSLAQDRLLAMLAREREGLAPADHDVPRLPVRHAVADVAPFPLPVTESAEGVRRVPKGRLANASGRPLSADVAAAIARVTGHTEPGSVAASASGIRRGRLELVPLGEPSAPSSVSTPAPATSRDVVPLPVLDLRDPATSSTSRRPARPAPHACPACGTSGAIDVIDHVSGLAHLSCPHCFRMWREDMRDHADVEAP